MNRVLLAAGLAVLCASSAFARDVYVDGYTKRDGTYVAPHHRTSPDGNSNNNYGTMGNPWTGQPGRQPSLPQPSAPTWGGYQGGRYR